MTEKHELIRRIVALHEYTNRFILEYKTEMWLSLELTIAQLKSILFIYERGRVKFRELAEALDVTPSVVTGLVDRLLTQNMLERQADADDRRVQWLALTPKAINLIDGIKQQTNDKVVHILKSMNTEDLRKLIEGFSAFIKAAEPYLETRKNSPSLHYLNPETRPDITRHLTGTAEGLKA